MKDDSGATESDGDCGDHFSLTTYDIRKRETLFDCLGRGMDPLAQANTIINENSMKIKRLCIKILYKTS